MFTSYSCMSRAMHSRTGQGGAQSREKPTLACYMETRPHPLALLVKILSTRRPALSAQSCHLGIVKDGLTLETGTYMIDRDMNFIYQGLDSLIDGTDFYISCSVGLGFA